MTRIPGACGHGRGIDGRVLNDRPGRAGATRPAAVRLDPVAAILDAFATHEVVALSEGPHGNTAGHAFRLALVRDPRFAATVNDIIVESGSARYQQQIDAYVRGDATSDDVLREALENSAVATPVWDRPIFPEFFRAVRALNQTLPAARRLRVLMGDPPIEWATVKTLDDYSPWLRQRDSYPAGIIQREVLARNRRALIVYGDGHLQARSERPARSMVALLEANGARVFAVGSTFADLTSFQPDAASWPVRGWERSPTRRSSVRSHRPLFQDASERGGPLRRDALARASGCNADGTAVVSALRRAGLHRAPGGPHGRDRHAGNRERAIGAGLRRGEAVVEILRGILTRAPFAYAACALASVFAGAD